MQKINKVSDRFVHTKWGVKITFECHDLPYEETSSTPKKISLTLSLHTSDCGKEKIDQELQVHM